ncbi:hypothetical protein K438DRAFT_1764220 [Mycena galopus ATCC 62051]|nr:hypothetical protein K438DRAFT_1764220 [Mycena galopus ATCC 62051]
MHSWPSPPETTCAKSVNLTQKFRLVRMSALHYWFMQPGIITGLQGIMLNMAEINFMSAKHMDAHWACNRPRRAKTNVVLLSARSASLVRRLTRTREFCEEIEYVDLTAQIVRAIPSWKDQPAILHAPGPSWPQESRTDGHIPQVAELLADFSSNHGKRLNAPKGRRLDGLAGTPELEVVLNAAMAVLSRHKNLDILEEECEMRVMGVGSASLQVLAVQHEIGEPLDLNGDILMDFFVDHIIRVRAIFVTSLLRLASLSIAKFVTWAVDDHHMTASIHVKRAWHNIRHIRLKTLPPRAAPPHTLCRSATYPGNSGN